MRLYWPSYQLYKYKEISPRVYTYVFQLKRIAESFVINVFFERKDFSGLKKLIFRLVFCAVF